MIPTLLGSRNEPMMEGAVPIPPWTLVVLEDTGEMLSVDAKERVGASLMRLLNLTDGLIGQGLKVMVLITTNEEGHTLHQAVTRPGRCAHQVTFAPLSATEADEWREREEIPGLVDGPRTLAELYAERAGMARPQGRRALGFVR